ncbi:hypothetical protein C0J52_27133, partial [Blattella germanica]
RRYVSRSLDGVEDGVFSGVITILNVGPEPKPGKGQTGPYGGKMLIPATKPILTTTNKIPKEEAEEGEHLVGEGGTIRVN